MPQGGGLTPSMRGGLSFMHLNLGGGVKMSRASDARLIYIKKVRDGECGEGLIKKKTSLN